jgi:hypothetical protein
MPFWNKRQQRERELLERLRRTDEQLELERQARALEEFERQQRERQAALKRQEIAFQEQERADRERREQEAKAARMRMVSPETLRELRELIRTRYELDVEIWSLRKVRKPDRPLVEEKMERSDAALGEIMNIVQAWDGTENSWTAGEWEQAQEIISRIEAEGKRIWAGNPPWEEN